MNIKYALALTISLAAFNLILFLGGYQTEKIATGQYLTWFTWVIQIAVLWFGIKAQRDESADKSLNYGQGVATGVLISLFGGLMTGVYTFIHFKFINPEFSERQLSLVKEKWAASGMSDAQIEKASAFAEKMIGPVSAAITTPFVIILLGTVFSLIIAAILKRPAANQTPQPPAAA